MKKHTFILPIFLFLGINLSFSQTSFFKQLADSTVTLTQQKVIYNPAYFRISYPNGDIPARFGVCTDVVIRAYRKMGIDLQKLVHEDMQQNFNKYPKIWGLKSTDKNIDHRRVPNLMTFFKRNNASLNISRNSNDYQPGDIVCWNLGGATTHIGLVVQQKSIDRKRHLIVHNIGAGQIMEDVLFSYKIIGHYRYPKN